MRKLLTLSISLAIVISFAVAASGVEWTPDAKDIGKLESILRLSKAELITPGTKPPAPLAKYARFYAGITVSGHRRIRGALLLATPPGMRVVPEKDLPRIMDGGCGIIYLLYDPETARVIWVRCNGLA
ncbi:MAG TPA: hypothetical protein VNU97_17955 [Rhizomicrobium sp.]|jgi:hypothetical protein|nr:hypothetical protein [Rhizomicrobium sp.]